MTLLICSNSDGSRRCDEKCYNATEPDCDCCCGGVNHGGGLEKGIQNMREVVQGWEKITGVEIPLLHDPFYQAEAAGQLYFL